MSNQQWLNEQGKHHYKSAQGHEDPDYMTYKTSLSPSLPPNLFQPGPPPTPGASPDLGYYAAQNVGRQNYSFYPDYVQPTPPSRPRPTDSQNPARPTMRLSHLEHLVVPDRISNSNSDENNSGFEQARHYYDVMQTTRQKQVEQSSRVVHQTPRSQQQSRGTHLGKPPSLAATHPGQYRAAIAQMVAPQANINVPTYSQLDQARRSNAPLAQVLVPLADTTKIVKPSQISQTRKSMSPSESIPYNERCFDPMAQTFATPTRSRHASNFLSSDYDIAIGNVIAPTQMISLPLGGTIELANRYPSEDELREQEHQK